MQTINSISLTTVFYLCITASFAQIGKMSIQEFNDFKNRKLLVILEEPNEKMASKLDPEQKGVYLKEIEEYNQLITWGMGEYYKLQQPVEFVKRSDAVTLLKVDKKTYAYLVCSKFEMNYTSKPGFTLVQKNRAVKEQTRLSSALSLSSLVTELYIRFSEDYRLIEDNQNSRPVYSQFMPDPFFDKGDIAYVLREMNATFSERAQGIDATVERKLTEAEKQQVRSQPLLIAEADIDPDENRDKFFLQYAYPVNVVDYSRISEAISNGEQVSCLITIPTFDYNVEQTVFRFVMFDCARGMILTSSKPQEKSGVSTATVSAFKSLKKAVTESVMPQLTKENMMDFNVFLK
jgi:hypothetical protein